MTTDNDDNDDMITLRAEHRSLWVADWDAELQRVVMRGLLDGEHVRLIFPATEARVLATLLLEAADGHV